MSSGISCAHGNDTIDPSPLIPGEATKILCITIKTYAEISQAYKAFRDFIKRPAARKVVEFKRPAQPKSRVEEINSQGDYDPTNAIYCNKATGAVGCALKNGLTNTARTPKHLKDFSLIK